MFDEDVLKKVMVVVLNVDVDTIGADSSMDTISAWDSLNHMNLILAIEDEFKIYIPDEDASGMTSYPIICLVVRELLEKNDGLAS